MIQIFDTRLIIQRDNKTKEKYYPRVLTASVTYEYPFTVPTATIEIWTNKQSSTSGYISPVRIPDIVRLQVSTKQNPKEKQVWETIFEGRIRDIESTFDTQNGNTTVLFCLGHIQSQALNLIGSDHSYASTTDAKTIIHDILTTETYSTTTYMQAVYNDSFTATGCNIKSYNAPANKRMVADIFQDLEKLSNFKYYFSMKNLYDANDNLAACYIRWQPFPTKPTSKYAVIEGSQRLISVDFKSSAEELWNYIQIFGDTQESVDTTSSSSDEPVDSTQYTGGAYSSVSINTYGARQKALDVNSLESNNNCTRIAEKLVERFRYPIVSGSATILGTPQARLGDLIRVKVPSLEINGKYVDRNYHVWKVQHDIDKDKFETSLDFTKVKKTPEDFIAVMQQDARKENMNDITTSDTTASGTDEDDGVYTADALNDTSDEGDSGYTDTSLWSDNTDTTTEDYGQ